MLARVAEHLRQHARRRRGKSRLRDPCHAGEELRGRAGRTESGGRPRRAPVVQCLRSHPTVQRPISATSTPHGRGVDVVCQVIAPRRPWASAPPRRTAQSSRWSRVTDLEGEPGSRQRQPLDRRRPAQSDSPVEPAAEAVWPSPSRCHPTDPRPHPVPPPASGLPAAFACSIAWVEVTLILEPRRRVAGMCGVGDDLGLEDGQPRACPAPRTSRWW